MRFLRILRSLLRRNRADRELDAEVRAHLDLLTEEKMTAGLDAAAARRAARIELGGVEQVKEEVREARSGVWLEQLGQDVRFGARQLRRNPGFSVLAGIALALAIGLNAAIFTVFNGLLLRPLPARDAKHLVSLYSSIQGERVANTVSYPEYAYCRDQNTSFTTLAAYAGGRVLMTGAGSPGSATSEWLQAKIVSASFFSLFGAVPATGRVFLQEEDQTPGAHPVVMISYDLWQSRFGGDPATIGTTLTLNSLPYTIVGVAPRGFIGADPEVPDVWIPLAMSANVQSGPPLFEDRAAGWLVLLARLKPEVTIDAAQAEMQVIAARFHAADPASERKPTLLALPASFLTPSQQSETFPIAVLLMGAVVLVLLIACANVANLQLARGVARQKELGIRTALGGSRLRIVRQLLVESLLLSAIAGCAGLLLSSGAANLILALSHPSGGRAMSLELSPDWRVALYLAAISLGSGIVSGLLPALRVSRQDPLHSMREESGAEAWRRGSNLRSMLVVGQVALSLFLLVAAGLLTRALGKARTVELGFDSQSVAVLHPDLRVRNYDTARVVEFEKRLSGRIAALPGVRSVSLARTVPLGTDFSQTSVFADDSAADPARQAGTVNFNVVTHQFFDTLAITLVRGRSFTPAEVSAESHVAVVSESLARQLWPGGDAIGKRLRRGRKSPLYEVVGVARDVRNVYLWAGSLPYLYLPMISENLDQYSDPAVIVRTSGDASALAHSLPRIVREMDPTVTSKASKLAENLEFWTWPSQLGARLAATLGLLALLLASVGIASITAFAATQRMREIGIRMALGAAPTAVLSLLLRQTGRLVAIGAAIGLAAAAAASRLLAQFLYGLSAMDAVAFAGTTILLVAATLAACYLPARRAARVDPLVALRYE